MPDIQTKPFTGPELCSLEAHKVVDLLKAGEVSPQELIDASFERMTQVEPAVNAIPTTCRERAEEAARSLGADFVDHPGWLAGLPLGIKDLDRVKGVRCTFGTKAMADYVPDFSEHFVERLEERGGVVVGKTNTPEMGAGANTFNDVFGATRNPWDTRMNAAGSSGGAAVSLATGETWLSQGSDHGGSLRTPAAYCGIVGLRTTPGRVPHSLTAGTSAGYLLEGLIGPMARSVKDCALFLDAMSGFEPSLPISFPAPEISFQETVARADGKVRIAFAPDLNGFSPVEKAIDNCLRDALKKVVASGGAVEEDCPELPNLERTYHVLRGFGFVASYSRVPESVSKHFKPTIQGNWEFGQSLSLQDVADANIDRTTIFLNMHSFLQNFDVLACPTVGNMPRLVEEEWVTEVNGQKNDHYMDWLRFTFLATTAGLPAISVPVGLSADGMPIGIQLIVSPRGEAKLLAVAKAVEAAVGGPMGVVDPNVKH